MIQVVVYKDMMHGHSLAKFEADPSTERGGNCLIW